MAFLAGVPATVGAAGTLAGGGFTLATSGLIGSAGVVSAGSLLSGVGTLVGAISAISQGRAAQQQADLQAEIFRREAERERLVSKGEASDFARQSRRLLARQRALAGGSGVQIGTGTPLELSVDTAEEAEFQRLKILSGGEADVSRLLSRAALEREKGRAARRAGFIRGGSLLLRGAGQTFGKSSTGRHHKDEKHF